MNLKHPFIITLLTTLLGVTNIFGFTEFSDNPIVILEISKSDELCNLGNGEVTITIANPSASTLYSINNGVTFQASNHFDNLESGDYLIIVVDNNNCSETVSIQVSEGPPPQIDLTYDCIDGLNKVHIDLTPFAIGVFPFGYQWEGPNNTAFTTQDLNEVDPGEYYVTVTDRLGCQILDQIYIEPCCELSTNCISDTIYIPCISGLDSIPSAFKDSLVNNDEDLLALMNQNILALDNCGDVRVMVTETSSLPLECTSDQFEIVRNYQIDDGVSSLKCNRTFVIDNYLGLNLVSPALDKSISCDTNVDIIFQDWLDNVGFANFKACSDTYSITTNPIDPLIDFSCQKNGEISVTFIIEDECYNMISTTSTFSVFDNSPPQLTCPLAITIQQDDPNLLVIIDDWIEQFSAVDICSTSELFNSFDPDQIIPTCNSQIISVDFIAIDDCQNISQCTSTISIEKIFSASINCPNDLTFNCVNIQNEAAITQWINSVVADDGNNNVLLVETNTSFISLSDMNCGDIVDFEFIVNDPCAQGLNCHNTLSLIDDTAPIILCPNDITLQQDAVGLSSQITQWLDGFEAIDNCAILLNSNNFMLDLMNLNCHSQSIPIEFESIDNCNNLSTCTSTLTIEKIFSPSINCPNNLVVECPSPEYDFIVSEWISSVTANDGNSNALPIEVITSFTSTINLSCGEIVPFEFEINDPCAEGINCLNQITLIDNSAPTLLCPSNITISQDDPQLFNIIDLWLMDALASDNCGQISTSNDYNSSIVNLTCSSQVISVVFSAFDDCQNISNCVSKINIEKIFAPSINCPTNLIFNCVNLENEISTIDWFESVNADDGNNNALPIQITTSFSSLSELQCGDIIDVTFEVDDPCAQGLNCQNTIALIDNLAPIILCPDNITIQLDDSNIFTTIETWIQEVSSVDNCNIIANNNSFDYNLVIASCESYDISVEFSTTDACLNQSICLSNITLEKIFTPSMTCPPILELSCIDIAHDITINDWVLTANGSDGINALPITVNTDYSSIINMSCGDEEVFEFVLDHPCAQGMSCFSQISIIDNAPPDIICPQEITIATGESMASNIVDLWINGSSASDNCSEVVVNNTFDSSLISDLCNAPAELEIVFTTVDECDNEANCISHIIVAKSEVNLICPSAIVLECGDINNGVIFTEWLESASAFDHNGFSFDVNNDANPSSLDISCGESVMINFESYGACQEYSLCTSIISLIDTQAPIIQCPENTSIDLNHTNAHDELNLWLQSYSSVDLCTEVQVENDFVLNLSTFQCTDIFEVTFTSEDECGNINDCSTVLQLSNEGIIHAQCPPEITVGCFDSNLNETIIQLINNVEVLSEYGYQMSTDFDIENFDTNCELPETVLINVQVTDECENISDCTIQINLLPEPKLFIPNVFEPFKGDVNSYFTIYGNTSVEKVNYLIIFNRWGSKLFEKENFQINDGSQGWDGYYNSTKEDLNTFTYVGSARDIFGNDIEFMGTVQLIR